MGQYTSKQWNEMTEVNRVLEKSEEQKQKQNSGGKKNSLTSRVKSRVLKSGQLKKISNPRKNSIKVMRFFPMIVSL